MHNERCTSGSEGGHQNPTAAMRALMLDPLYRSTLRWKAASFVDHRRYLHAGKRGYWSGTEPERRRRGACAEPAETRTPWAEGSVL